MNSTKKILAGLACAFLPLILLLFGSLVSTYQTLGGAGQIKDALAESGIYSAVVKEGVNHISQDASAQATGNIPVDRPEVRAVIEQALPPSLLERQAEGVIDGFYAWLRGDAQTMQFQIDLTEAKTKLADGLAAHAAQRMETLPECTALDGITADYDPFNATCVPKGMNKDLVANKVRNEILNNDKFLNDPVINAQDLNANNSKEIQIGNISINRDVYDQTKTNMYITGVLSVVLALAILFLSRTRRTGVRRLGIIVTVVGGVSAMLAGVLSFVLDALAQRLAQSAEGTNLMERSVVDVVRLLTQDIRNWWFLYGLSLLAVGVITLVVLAVTRRKQPETAPSPVESPAEALKTPDRKPEDKLKYPRS